LSDRPGETRALRRLDVGIFLASFTVLLVELLLTRILSVTMFPHFSFLAVAVAMTGLGASGLAVTLWPGRFSAHSLPRVGRMAALTFAITAVLVVGIAFRIPILLEMTAGNWVNVLAVFVISVVPFTAGGLVIAMILSHNTRHASRLYGIDMIGAGAACLFFIPVTNLVGAPTAVIVASAVAALSGAALSGGAAPGVQRACLFGAGGFTLLAALNTQVPFFDVRVAKGMDQPGTLGGPADPLPWYGTVEP